MKRLVGGTLLALALLVGGCDDGDSQDDPKDTIQEIEDQVENDLQDQGEDQESPDTTEVEEDLVDDADEQDIQDTEDQQDQQDQGDEGLVEPVEVTPENIDDLQGEPTSEEDLQQLADWMTGRFDSEEMEGLQDTDEAGVYTFIWADLNQIRIWPEEEGYWLYVEQSEHGSTPYRTRLYHLDIQDENTYIVDNYKLPYGSTTYSGAFDDPTLFDGLSVADTGATHNPGCNVTIKKIDGVFYGHNDASACTVNVGMPLNLDTFSAFEEEELYSHDRGYNENGDLQLGPGNFGYTFLKRENFPVE